MSDIENLKEEPVESSILEASSRVAIAALLHDLGKLAERAKLEIPQDRLKGNIHQYCPYNQKGNYHSHQHAAYTGAAFDAIERLLPDVKKNIHPFIPNTDNSLINGAARHHRPETFLQWIIATADRVASGFERQQFEKYNETPDEDSRSKGNHYTARLATLFEQISIEGKNNFSNVSDLKWRYQLNAMSPSALFPKKREEVECNNELEAQDDYGKIWKIFKEGLEKIPVSHRKSLPLWLDHFDTLWACVASFIPSATVWYKTHKLIPDVSLYDHSKAVAALAVALWRYHVDHKHEEEEIRDLLSKRDNNDWDEKKLLLIQGDSFGIQDFIFATGGSTQKRAAKLLRGRSFYVSLFAECAALSILERLGLPSTSQILNAAGKFLIVAPNTEATKEVLKEIRKEFNSWFLQYTWGQSCIGLAWTEASCNDLLKGKFDSLLKQLFKELDTAKYQRFDLCSKDAPEPIFSKYLESFSESGAVCQIDGRSPAIDKVDGVDVSKMAQDHIEIGKYLTSNAKNHILITREKLTGEIKSLNISIFGYNIAFASEISDDSHSLVKNLVRCWDYELPKDSSTPLWNGFARRYVNGYIPEFSKEDELKIEGKYASIKQDEIDLRVGNPKTFDCIACEDRIPKSQNSQEDPAQTTFVGVSALMTLKGDVDNLGSIFQKGLSGKMTFARVATLSRQINAFFAIYLPYLCKTEYPNTYTVFAGGDDFFLIGPWLSQMKLAERMKVEFARYVANNAEITFSAGLSMTKSGLPIRALGHVAEEALKEAKDRKDPEDKKKVVKNAINCFGYTRSWKDYELLLASKETLAGLATELKLSSGYVYSLLTFCDMRENLKSKEVKVENARWRSMFAYRTCRMLEQKKITEEVRCDYQQKLVKAFVENGIEKFDGAYKIPLWSYIYQQRD